MSLGLDAVLLYAVVAGSGRQTLLLMEWRWWLAGDAETWEAWRTLA